MSMPHYSIFKEFSLFKIQAIYENDFFFENGKETSVKLNPTGSVLIAMYGATIGKIGVLFIRKYHAVTTVAVKHWL